MTPSDDDTTTATEPVAAATTTEVVDEDDGTRLAEYDSYAVAGQAESITALAPIGPPIASFPTWEKWQQMERMADALARSPLSPKHLVGKANACLTILLAAHDLRLSATVAMQEIAVIDGKPTMSAKLMRMLVRRDGHEIRTTVTRNEHGRAISATAEGRRAGTSYVESASFTIWDAASAGLCTIDNDGIPRASVTKDGKTTVKPWESYTEDMLIARATSRLCRRMFEESLGGVSYTSDEARDFVDAEWTTYGDGGSDVPRPPDPDDQRAQAIGWDDWATCKQLCRDIGERLAAEVPESFRDALRAHPDYSWPLTRTMYDALDAALRAAQTGDWSSPVWGTAAVTDADIVEPATEPEPAPAIPSVAVAEFIADLETADDDTVAAAIDVVGPERVAAALDAGAVVPVATAEQYETTADPTATDEVCDACGEPPPCACPF